MSQKMLRNMAGWCCSPLTACRRQPPRLEADSAGKRAADSVVRVGDAAGGWVLIGVILALFIAGGYLPERGSLAVNLVAFLLGSCYCLLNFWRCREPHCIVTGVGWSLLSGFTAAEVASGRSLVGGSEELIFVGILVLAFGFELIWRATTGTNALVRTGQGDDRRAAAGRC